MANSNEKSVSSSFRNATLAVVGILVFGLHIGLFYVNQFYFNILVCTYVVIYAIIVLISVSKNRDCFTKGVFSVLINYSIYTLILQVFLVGFTIVMMSRKKK
jgi:hypothetical protein